MATKMALTSANTCPECGGRQVIIDLYCRISRATDGEGGFVSVDDQEEDGRFALAAMGCCFVVGQVWKDPAKSAWNPKVQRPDFERMMARLETRAAQGVWVYDLTRFSRKPIEGERLISIAEVGTRVLGGDSTYDLSTADGKKQFRDAMNAAAHESNKTSERTRRGKQKKAVRRGRSNATIRGFGVAGYLRRPENWEPGDEVQMVPPDQLAAEQAILSVCAEKLLSREMSAEQLADYMNEQGFTTTTGRMWTGSLLRQKFERPSLCGLLEYRGEIIPGKKLPEPHALTEETWRSLQDLFRSRARGKPAEVYLLSGLLHCGLCGSLLYGRPNTAHRPYADGAVRRNYWCQKVRHKDRTVSGCAGVAIDWRFTDGVVADAVVARLGDERHASVLAQAAEVGAQERAAIVEKIERAKRTAKDMAYKVGADVIDDEDYEAFLAGHTRKMKRLRVELDALNVPEPPKIRAAEAAAKWAAAESDLEMRRTMVREAFPRLTILPATTRGPYAKTLDRFDWEGGALSEFTL